MRLIGLFICVLLFNSIEVKSQCEEVVYGNAQTASYLPLLKGKKVGLLVNQTSFIGKTSLVDTLLSCGVDVRRLFVPEHGFRGDADAGEKVSNTKDAQTGLPIVSLYGKTKKPLPADLSGLDWVVFDIQDVGVRFYTYISTLHYIMESCAENGVGIMVLDRPNPNGDYVAGPVLDLKYRSFVGMHPIPVVYGLTIGELASMINGEHWLKDGVQCKLKVIGLMNYTHDKVCSVPVKPSPNLPNLLSIRIYSSLCFFEATNISVGRGTNFPFQVIGYPTVDYGNFSFTPVSMAGSKNPMHENKTCYGEDLRNMTLKSRFTVEYLVKWHRQWTEKTPFFTNRQFFNLLAGNDLLIGQIESGLSVEAIEQSWQADIIKYLQIRQKYLLYR